MNDDKAKKAMIALDRQRTALVLIDLQLGILSRPMGPHSAAQVVAKAALLAGRCRAVGAPVVLVHVGWSADLADAPKQPVDQPAPVPEGGFPADWMDFVPDLGVAPSDIIVTKRQWGAFYGTELDLQLRRRGIDTIVIGGVATNIGVESTSRAAWEHGYAVVLAEDAASTTGPLGAEMHRFTVSHIFPRLGRVRSTSEILAALS